MDPRIKVHGNNWLFELGEKFPESADQLDALADHLFTKQEKLAALIRHCAAHPELPMLRMYAEYSAALDAVALEPPREVELEVSDEEAGKLDSRARAGRTKLLRTRARIVEAASQLLGGTQPLAIDKVCELSRVSKPTFYNHFRLRSQLVAAAYAHLTTNS